MHVKWKTHELVFVTLLAAAGIGSALMQWYQLTEAQLATDFIPRYTQHEGSFNYVKYVLLPQIGSVLLLYGCYWAVNGLILPMLKRISFRDLEHLATKNVAGALLVFAAVAYLLALGINVASWYARPHLSNYGGFQLLALLGYNDTPLSDLFFGVERAAGLLLLLTVWTGLRELLVWRLERPGAGRDYRVLIVNNITPLVVVYLSVLVFYNPVHRDFVLSFMGITPIFLLYLYTTFWLFPSMGGQRLWWQRPEALLLLLASFACAFPFGFLMAEHDPFFHFILYWAFLLLVVVPVSWLLFQQRKEQIIQFKGMQTALARSDAHLQFLRAQINPHFLFNALNTLYGTALKEGSEQAATGIQKLGDMMRFMLQENQLDFIPMEREIEYLGNYIDLQKLRIQDSWDIQIEANINAAKCQHTIAPMLLIPFVENAFKHGIRLQEKSWILINLDCTEQELRFEVRNSLHPRTDTGLDPNPSGIGLKNVTERLRLLYPGQHTLSLQEDKNEFVAQLSLVHQPINKLTN